MLLGGLPSPFGAFDLFFYKDLQPFTEAKGLQLPDIWIPKSKYMAFDTQHITERQNFAKLAILRIFLINLDLIKPIYKITTSSIHVL